MAETTDLDLIVAALLETRQAMAYRYGVAACIVCSRVAVDVCRRHGVAAREMPVAVRGEQVAKDLGFTGMSFPGLWDGHMVALIDERLVLDLTIDQLPGVHGAVTPSAFAVGPGFALGEPTAVIIGPYELVYTAHPSDETHTLQEDWTDDPERDKIVPAVERKIARRLAS